MIYELEFAAGLSEIVRSEVQQKLGLSIQPKSKDDGYLRLNIDHPAKLHQLKTINSVYLCLYFDIPRPRALLGHKHFTRLINHITHILDQDFNNFHTLYISAAGSNSSTMQRLKHELALRLNLQAHTKSGDLWLRIKRQGNGWEVLIRTTPRPLATRSWRVCNYEGALNAPVAHAIGLLTSPGETVVNLMCGSGTLMIEYPHSYNMMVGLDNYANALTCAEQNIQAAPLLEENRIRLINASVTDTPFPSASVDVLLADLPFGQLIGSHRYNQKLYPEIIKEAARIAKPNAQFAVITHEIKLFERLLTQSLQWRVESAHRVSLRGYHPRVFLLRKVS